MSNKKDDVHQGLFSQNQLEDLSKAATAILNLDPSSAIANSVDDEIKLVDEKQAEISSVDEQYNRLKGISLGQDIQARKKYSDSLYSLTIIWLLSTLIIILFQGFGFGFHINLPLFNDRVVFEGRGFELSDTVLVSLVTTTTVSVLGIYRFVVRYLFSTKAKD